MTLNEYLEQATYAYILSVQRSSFLTQLWKKDGVVRAEKYLKDMPQELEKMMAENIEKNIKQNAEQVLEQKILGDLRDSQSDLASSTDYKKFIALAVLAYQNQCSVDILRLGISACARESQNNMQPIITTAQVCTLPDLETLKNNLISSCIRGCVSDKELLAKKIGAIKVITELAYKLDCKYKVMADAAVACLEKLKQTEPNLTMSVLLKRLVKENKPELKALSLELHKENNVIEMSPINEDSTPPRISR